MKTLGIKATFILGESIINVFVKPAQHAFLLNANETRFMRRGQLKETILLLAAVAAVMVFFAWFVTTPAAVGEGPSPQFDFSEAECPVSGPVAAGFLPPQRLGTGFAAPAGTRVVAPFNATVAFAGEAGGCGNAVELFHGLDAEGRGVYTGYCFLSETFVQRGQSVSRGQPIGLSGKRGGTPELYLKLHFFSGGSGIASADDAFDLTRNQFVDPMQYFGRCGTS